VCLLIPTKPCIYTSYTSPTLSRILYASTVTFDFQRHPSTTNVLRTQLSTSSSLLKSRLSTRGHPLCSNHRNLFFFTRSVRSPPVRHLLFRNPTRLHCDIFSRSTLLQRSFGNVQSSSLICHRATEKQKKKQHWCSYYNVDARVGLIKSGVNRSKNASATHLRNPAPSTEVECV
jgi:hypothetical protein